MFNFPSASGSRNEGNGDGDDDDYTIDSSMVAGGDTEERFGCSDDTSSSSHDRCDKDEVNGCFI